MLNLDLASHCLMVRTIAPIIALTPELVITSIVPQKALTKNCLTSDPDAAPVSNLVLPLP